MKLTFVGGAGSVTGACYLLEHNDARILIDCGLSQGPRELEELNFKPFSFESRELAGVLITHSHIDHIGRVPQLMKHGFVKKIYSTAPTKDSAYELLLDAHNLMMNDLKKDQEPLYETVHIDQALDHWETICYHQHFSIGPFEIEAFNSGHILGSASYLIRAGGKSIAFSGDLGNIPAPLVKDTEYIEQADYALIESAYGGRVHEPINEREGIIEDMIEDVARSGGVLLIPAFAMERTQQLLYEINALVEQGRIPRMPVFIDSPLAIRLTEIYQKYLNDSDYFDMDVAKALEEGREIFSFPGLRFTLTTEESKTINMTPAPKVVIAGSGMSNGGRILHHEIRYLPDPNSIIFFVGYQVEGSLGRQVLDGASSVRIMGEDVSVRARVKAVGGFSAHADQPLLLQWVLPMKTSLKKLFVVQGEQEQSEALAAKVRDEFAIDASVPEVGMEVEL